ncbi:DNA/RNA polymerases superfamily protein [Gossypium australe]|uniref:DNA/RNA polymerases superfamily protein n=1 Tax=Gossypium australe TaxID=47621 RepID=A0A5B6VLN3_9ROSI|nr:DNA/RNA polymerases superfamily protein [Gossypium australe]
MALDKVFYGHKCRGLLYWSELNERKLAGVDLVWETEEKVRIIYDNLKATSDHQKSYADLKHKDIKFFVCEIFLALKKSIMFWKKREKRIGIVAYCLAVPPELDRIHNIFHVSMLRCYRSNLSHVLTTDEIELQLDLTYNEEPVRILAWETKEWRNKRVPLVKVLWCRHGVEEATRET